MLKIASYGIAILLSFNVFAGKNPVEVRFKQPSALTEVSAQNFVPSLHINKTEPKSAVLITTSIDQVDIVKELTIYGLIILVYSLCWLKISH